jgi:hypothetical protein
MNYKALLALMCLLALSGCDRQPPAAAAPSSRPTMTALHARHPIVLDGRLNDPIWERAPSYPLQLARDYSRVKKLYDPRLITGQPGPFAPGRAQLAWDEKYLYVAVQFTDADVVAEGTKDQLHQYKLGDTAELFLKPADQTCIWEMYATPAGHKTAFFHPGAGRIFLPSAADCPIDLEVAAHVNGTLNQWHDRDKGWSAEFAVPRDQLTAAGAALEEGTPWLILVSRYNYSRYLLHSELSSAPRLPHASFTLCAYYAWLKLTE